jgi:hypothetical protein
MYMNRELVVDQFLRYATRRWHNVYTGEPVTLASEDGQPALAVAEGLAHCPGALLVVQDEAG